MSYQLKVTITGPQGSGKTRLIDVIRAAGYNVGPERPTEYGSGTTVVVDPPTLPVMPERCTAEANVRPPLQAFSVIARCEDPAGHNGKHKALGAEWIEPSFAELMRLHSLAPGALRKAIRYIREEADRKVCFNGVKIDEYRKIADMLEALIVIEYGKTK